MKCQARIAAAASLSSIVRPTQRMRTPDPSTLFISLFVLVGFWFLMLALVWRRLISRHPGIYEAKGSPHFLRPLGAISTLRFVVTRAHRKLGDRVLGWLSDGALVALTLYLCGFAWLIALAGTSP
jgi:hypothetical protein